MQFTNAERATDWKGNNNIAEAIFKQLKEDLYEEPTWIVVGGGTGGTATTLARHVRCAIGMCSFVS
jgi:cysteine synthase A